MKLFTILLTGMLLLLGSSRTAYATATTISLVCSSTTAAAIADNAVDTTNGDRWLNLNGDGFLIVRNTHASSSATYTITAQTTSITVPGYGTLTAADKAISLAAGDIKIIGPLPRAVFNDSSGYVVGLSTGTAASSVKVSPMCARPI